MVRKITSKYLGLILGIVTLLLFQILSFTPGIIEVIYTGFIYKGIRFVYAYSLYYFPFALMWVFIAVVLFLILRHIRRRWAKKNKQGSFLFVLNFLGWLIFLFYWLWGMNYARLEFKDRIALAIEQPTTDFLIEELVYVDSLMHPIRKMISENDTIALPEAQLPIDFQRQIREAQKRVIKEFNEPKYANVRVRQLKPKGNLLRLKTAGVYFPFVLEGHIDDGLHAIEKPYVLAHEMAHANAFTDEGVCNFIGFLTAVNAEDPFIQYSGWLEYYGYLYRTLRRNHPDKLEEINYKRPDFVIADLKAIIAELDKYPNITPKLRDLFYNNYLKAQGIKAGMKSYSQIVRLAYSHKRRAGSFILD